MTGKDIREHGSGNAGMTNTMRIFGFGMGVMVFVLDFFKGAVAFYFGRVISGTYAGSILCGVAAVIGHDFPVFLNFRGGKGVATTLGVIVALHHSLGSCILVLGILASIITRKISLVSLCGLITAPILMAIFDPGNAAFQLQVLKPAKDTYSD